MCRNIASNSRICIFVPGRYKLATPRQGNTGRVLHGSTMCTSTFARDKECRRPNGSPRKGNGADGVDYHIQLFFIDLFHQCEHTSSRTIVNHFLLSTHHKGNLFHSSNWDPNVDLKGKRIALIGNGASGLQVLPSVQPLASHVDHYARNPTWIADSFFLDIPSVFQIRFGIFPCL
jgi:hypothetical protein